MKRAWMEIPCNESMLDLVYTYQASTSKSTRILHLHKRNTKAQDDQILTLLKMAQKHLKKKTRESSVAIKEAFRDLCCVFVPLRRLRYNALLPSSDRARCSRAVALNKAYASRP